MAFYESIFILRSSLAEAEAVAIQEKLKGALEKLGASIIKADNWGKKKLAYEVGHDRRGTYSLFQFEASGNVVGELERLYRLEDSVMKFLTVRVEEEDLKPKEEAVKTVESDSGGV
ncbi:30S ribosomal protein S6 [Candidatus Nitronereus thalassa]|uniref:Small ribosomal subunit protein bS6 n=1 Tax=Candidatus Nitronereus thalassa TaxID=3020898 RepID=A0ABU3K7J7_9BACT|nr:30S ribosomal protein S6 [Candidatus Nitronereus thalassa]MDT7042337.1 30S ribosomal protein S6 [Candidatus Nitronereus thalassa]